MLEKSLEIKKMDIKYVFTEGEKRDIADQLTKRVAERDELDQEKKEVTSTYNAQIKRADNEISTMSTEYRQGYKMKVHPCYEVFDYDEKTVHIHRADNDARVDSRTMTAEEFQREVWDPRQEIKELPQETTSNNKPDCEIVEGVFTESVPDDTDPELLEPEDLLAAEET